MTASNAFNLTVTAASVGASLASVAASTTAGTWARWTGGDISSAHTNPSGTGDPVISNGLRAIWDATRKKFYYYGHGHSGRQSRMLTFDDATSTWSSTNSGSNVPLADGGTDAHQFSGYTGNGANGFLFFNAGDGGGNGNFRRNAGSTAWSSVAQDPAGAHSQVAGAAFNPNIGTQGAAILGSLYGVEIYDVANNSWTENWRAANINGPPTDPSGNPPIGNNTVGFWSPRANAVYFADTVMIKVATSGAHSQVGNPPVRPYFGQSADYPNEAFAADGYVSTFAATNGRTRRPIIVNPGSNMYRYNELEDTWTTLGIAPPAWINSNMGGIYAVVPDYDGIIFWIQSGTLGDMSAYYFKHAAADES